MTYPPHPDAPVNPTTIMLAPELAVLALLDEVITIATYAIFAAHPRLGDPEPVEPAPPAALAAGQLIDRLRDCRVANYLYRYKTLHKLVDSNRGDDIPF
ncbi:MAG: hypothetical protein DRI90_15390 [Deltaproteobacteria bacterium]|nr:MAG: hypothetical protein DRI90_15390 [Deltaproteobacteria bacterium]